MSQSNHTKSVTVTSQTSNIRKVVSELMGFVVGATNIEEDELSLVLSEAVTNAIIHGNKKNPRRKVFAQATVKPQKVIFKVTDEGTGFDYKNLPSPKEEENLRKQYGRGLFLIRYFMDEVHFNYVGNEITMIKYKNG